MINGRTNDNKCHKIGYGGAIVSLVVQLFIFPLLLTPDTKHPYPNWTSLVYDIKLSYRGNIDTLWKKGI